MTNAGTSSPQRSPGRHGEGSQGIAVPGYPDERVRARQNVRRPARRSALKARAAILDRLLHHSTTISIKGESYRLKDRKKAGLVTLPATR